MSFVLKGYGPTFEPLLSVDRLRALDEGESDRAALAALDNLTHESAFIHARIVNRDMAQCCLAGVWLLHDYLDESHTISQRIETSSGSFWHGIMHRREGDYSNAKYWFRRVGDHPVYAPLAERAAKLADEQGERSPKFISDGAWEPFAFVDACQRAVRNSEGANLCRAVQQVEWELLFDYCYRTAVGQAF